MTLLNLNSFLVAIFFVSSSFVQAQDMGADDPGFEAFKRNVYPVIRQQCAQCHDNGGKGPNHSSSDAFMSYQKVLGYTNFGNLKYSKFITKGTNGHPQSYGGSVTVTEEDLIRAFQRWWDEGENTSFLRDKLVLESQGLPGELSQGKEFAEMSWELSEISQSLAGVRFVVEIQRYMEDGDGHMGAYRVRNPHFEFSGGQNLFIQGIHVVVNGAYDSMANNYSQVRAVTSSDRSVSQSYQIITEKKGADQDVLSFAFEKVELTDQELEKSNVRLSENSQRISPNSVQRQSSIDAFKTDVVGISARFVPISAPVEFEMGSPEAQEGRDSDEKLHPVKLTKPFEIQATEVTQHQWYLIMQGVKGLIVDRDGKDITAIPSLFKSSCDDNGSLKVQGGTICKDHPVEQVSWDDIQVFLSRLNGLQSDYTYRLPTEAEWEYVAKSGLPSEYAYGFGGDFDGSYAWFFGNSNGSTHKVASTSGGGIPSPSNPEDMLYDMHGNVWEWVQDWYKSDYPTQLVVDPVGPQNGSARIIRGGSWSIDPQFLRSANCNYSRPDYRGGSLGFRLVRTAR